MHNQIEQYADKIYNFKNQINLSQEDKLILQKQNDLIKDSLKKFLENLEKIKHKVEGLLEIDISTKNKK